MGVKNKSVLLIDDDNDFRIIIKKILENIGIVFFEANNIDSAMTLLDAQLPDLIILDLNLVSETGFDFIKKQREQPRLKDIPIIVCSSYTYRDNIQKVASLGITDFVAKPIKQTTLIQKIRRLTNKTEDLKYTFKEKERPALTASFDATLSGLSETSCDIHSSIRYPMGKRLKMEIELLNKNKVNHEVFETLDRSLIFQSGLYATKMSMIGLTEKQHEVIRLLIKPFIKYE